MDTLASYVHVIHPDGNVQELVPGQPVPDWAVPLVTNPKAWIGGEVPESAAAPPPVIAPPPPQTATLVVAAADTTADPVAVKAPPRGGAGSGRDAWSAYAMVNGQSAAADLGTREEIIAALEAAGVPVE